MKKYFEIILTCIFYLWLRFWKTYCWIKNFCHFFRPIFFYSFSSLVVIFCGKTLKEDLRRTLTCLVTYYFLAKLGRFTVYVPVSKDNRGDYTR